MKNEKHDRRSERTRRMIGEALVALMQERPYVQLTIQDILDRANIGRSTFYAHYFDKDDLLTSEIARVVGVLAHHLDTAAIAPKALLPSLGLFQHMQEQHRLYLALLHGEAITLVMQTMRHHLCAEMERQLGTHDGTSAIAITVTAHAAVGSLLALLQWWLEAGMPLSPEQLDAYYQRLVMPGVCAVMGW